MRTSERYTIYISGRCDTDVAFGLAHETRVLLQGKYTLPVEAVRVFLPINSIYMSV